MGLLDPILITPSSRGIKALQREAIPVDTLMTGVAGLVAFVLIDLLLDRDGFTVFGFQAGTLSGGGDKGVPTIFLEIQAPRKMGEVSKPSVVTFRTLPIVKSPPRGTSSEKFTLRIFARSLP